MIAKKLPHTFTELVSHSELPVLVNFWAEWCVPCHMISPSIKRIAAKYADRMITVKMNVDEKPQIAADFNVESVPTILMFKNGKEIKRNIGAMTFEALTKEIEELLLQPDEILV